MNLTNNTLVIYLKNHLYLRLNRYTPPYNPRRYFNENGYFESSDMKTSTKYQQIRNPRHHKQLLWQYEFVGFYLFKCLAHNFSRLIIPLRLRRTLRWIVLQKN